VHRHGPSQRRSSVSSSLDSGRQQPTVSANAYTEVHQSEQFQELKRRQRSIAFPLTGIFLAWYFLYVLLADYAHDFMSHKLWGNINVALVMGLLQFVSTFAITIWYVRYANRRLDPLAGQLRDELDGGDRT
jgi:uncharacterized membrane protein (DUF485 family)